MFNRLRITKLAVVIVVLTVISLPSVWADDYIIPGGTIPGGPKGESNPNGTPVKNPTTDGEPVHLDNGEYALSVTDISIQGRSSPITLERSYRSRSEYNSRFGYGWDMNYNLRIRRLHDPNVLVLLDGAGRKLEYKLDPASDPNAPKYLAPRGLYDFIKGNLDGTCTLYKKHGDKLGFDIDGNLIAITDRNGNSITFEYDPNGLLPLNGRSEYFVGQTYGLIALEFKLISITDNIGRKINLGYDSDGRLSSVTDFAGRVWSYTYDINNNLTSVKSPGTGQYPTGLTTTYAYDGKHNLISITDAKGQTYLVSHYNTNDRIDWQTYGDGQFTFTYDPNNKKTTVIDRKNFHREVTYNTTGNPVVEKIYTSGLRPGDPVSYATTYEYNSNMEKTVVTYPAGNEIYYDYDDKGNLLRICRKSTPVDFGWEFNTSGNAEGWTPQSGLSSFTVSDGSLRTRYTGSNPYMHGPTISLPARADHTISIRFRVTGTSKAQVYWQTSSGGWSETRHVDFNVKADGDFHRYTIAVGSHPAWTGIITQIRLDPAADSTSGDVDIDWIRITRNSDDPNDPNNLVTTFAYEPNFNFVKTVRDPKGNVTTYAYDYEDPNYGTEVGNLMKITYPTVGIETPEVRFTYNQFGQIETSTSPDGMLTKYEYYDANEPNGPGLLKRVIADYGTEPNCLNITTQFSHDILGNMVKVTDAMGNASRFAYDNLGQLIQSATPSPFNYVTNFGYDKNRNLSQTNRQTSDPNHPWQITSFAYNMLDKLQTLTNPLGNVTTFGYDKNENRSLVNDAEDNNSVYIYDERDLLWKATDAEGHTTEYSYDNNGNLRQIKDAKGNTTSYAYDKFDRLIKVTYPDDSNEIYAYDKNSNLISRTNRKGQVTLYEYDQLNRLVQKTPADRPAIKYGYDIASRLTDVNDGGSVTSYDYDRLGRNTKLTYPDGKQIVYEYDNLGRRTKLIYPDSTFITYIYDALSRLTDIKDANNMILLAHYSYDALSRRRQADFANETDATYTYDLADRLTNLSDNGSSRNKTFGYTHDNVGNRLSMTVDNTDVHNYTYDDIYQLINVQYPSTGSFAYNYDALGNRTSVVNGGTTNYVSNNLNQYTSVGGVSITYDKNGNLTNDGVNTYSYDSENRLISATTPSHVVSYTYDSFGRRITKTVDSVTTKYLYDSDQIIAEYDGSGTLIRKYVYGPGIDEPIAMIAAGQTYYYAFDGLGSVISLSSSSGTVVETYSYDVFGRPDTTSIIGNRFMFTGREYDTETGLYYYRARYYDSHVGRFLQTDPIGYHATFNLYIYVNNNPISWVDPYGLCKGKDNGKSWWQKVRDFFATPENRTLWYGIVTPAEDNVFGNEFWRITNEQMQSGNDWRFKALDVLAWGAVGMIDTWATPGTSNWDKAKSVGNVLWNVGGGYVLEKGTKLYHISEFTSVKTGQHSISYWMKGDMAKKSSLARRSLTALGQYEDLQDFKMLTELGEQANKEWDNYWEGK